MKPRRTTVHLLLLTLIASLFAGCSDTEDQNDADPEGEDLPWEVLESTVERDLSPEVDPGTSEQLAADNRDFAFALASRILEEEEPENLFFSPFSISLALAMTYPATSGDTRDQLAEVLRFTLDEEELHPAFSHLDLELATRSERDVDGNPPELNLVNATWGQYDFPFRESYLDTLAMHYGAGLFAVDFRSDYEQIRQQINQWVEDQTNERIQDLLPPDSLDELTVMVLVNTIYFLAGWDKEFSDSLTEDQPFTRLDGSDVDVEMMRQTDHFDYFLGEDTHAISLRYVGNQVSFVALKPAEEEDFSDWEQSLDRDHFDQVIDGFQYGRGKIALPRFRIEGDYDLMELFEAMGWEDYGELDGLVEGGHPTDAEITDILHKSYIDVDEEGTEAAAATAVIIGDVGAMPIEPEDDFDLTFDRPYYFAIYDHPTDTILFLGRVADPTAN